MIFMDNLTLTILWAAGIATVLLFGITAIFLTYLFFEKLVKEGNALQAWTVAILLGIVIIAGVKTWVFSK